jgi:hypothetical protein
MKINPAKVLLEDYLELKSLAPNIENWKEDLLLSNPPRYYRLLRIKACMLSLTIEAEDFRQFASGSWCRNASPELIENIELILTEPFQLKYEEYLDLNHVFSGRYMFSMLLQLREALYKLTSIRSGILAASGHFLTPIFMIEHLQQKTLSEQLALDEAIQLMLNPNEIRFNYSQMTKSYGFPDVNIQDIDLEWI